MSCVCIILPYKIKKDIDGDTFSAFTFFKPSLTCMTKTENSQILYLVHHSVPFVNNQH